VDLSVRPFRVFTDEKEVAADTLIVATGAVAKRLDFPGAHEGPGGYWNRGISACAVCDGAAPIFRGKPLAVIGGGDTAMEEASFLTKYGSTVYIIHRRDEFRASQIMRTRALENPKITVLWNSVVTAAEGDGKTLSGLRVRNVVSGEETHLPVSGLFFAIGHEPASKFLDGQLKCDSDGYIVTQPGGGLRRALQACSPAETCRTRSGARPSRRRAAAVWRRSPRSTTWRGWGTRRTARSTSESD